MSSLVGSSKHAPPYIVVWDLDDTLGNFEALSGKSDASDKVTVYLRPGIEGALCELMRNDFKHVLLTLATRTYAELALRGTGLRDAFSCVEGSGERTKGDVQGIAKSFNLPTEEQPHRMIFVGNHPIFDRPQDSRIVFHFEPHALTRSANELVNLLICLRETGNGSIRQGFNKLRYRSNRWYLRLMMKVKPNDQDLTRRKLPTGEEVLLVEHPDGEATVAFSESPDRIESSSAHEFVPSKIL